MVQRIIRPGHRRRLGVAKTEGAALVSAPGCAELLAYPGITEPFVNSFLEDTGIEIDFDLPPSVWLQAGHRFARNAQRRRATVAGLGKRLLADFIIGSHALHQADRLMTLDPLRYQRDFPELILI